MSNQCQARKSTGDQCQRSHSLGSRVCWQHGGELSIEASSSVSTSRSPDAFTTINKIGQGASGSVFLVKDKDGTNFVLKKVPKELASKSEIDKEVKILEFLKPYCREYILCYSDYFEDGDNYYLVTEHLENYVSLNQLPATLPNIRRVEIICNLVRGLRQIHSLGIAHRDIKPENILVDSNGIDIKYIDFGVSCQGDQCSNESVSGTPSYIAPELVMDKQLQPSLMSLIKADYWSLGMVIYYMVTKRPPFEMLYPMLTQVYEDEIKNLDQSQKMDVIMEKFAEYYSFPAQDGPLVNIDKRMMSFNDNLKAVTREKLGFEVSLTDLLQKDPTKRHL